jgi:hypothetical protein
MTEIWNRMQERGDGMLCITNQQDIIQVGSGRTREEFDAMGMTPENSTAAASVMSKDRL